MKSRKSAVILGALLVSAVVAIPATAQANLGTQLPIMNCTLAAFQTLNLNGVADNTKGLTNGGVTFTSVTFYSTGSVIPGGHGPGYTVPASLCQVVGFIGPGDPNTSGLGGDSGNGFVLWLPTTNWSQRYVQEGCGGECGSANLGAPTQSVGCLPATDGSLALATTDMGHNTGAPTWIVDNPWSGINFAYRGVHVTAQVMKAIIQDFYGEAPQYSYFDGCSDGGREALGEAQRYPNDFDGIAAGSPANNMDVQNTYHHAWRLLVNSEPTSPLTYPGYSNLADPMYHLVASGTTAATNKLNYLDNKVLAACDGHWGHGTKLGFLDDPRLCHFDINSLVCANNGNETGCLTQAQAEAAFLIHDGAKSIEGVRLEPEISSEWGSEIAWNGLYVPSAQGQGVGASMFVGGWLLADFINDPYISDTTSRTVNDLDWTLNGFRYTVASSELYSATNPDLRPFAKSGGKLIFWAGWADQHISPQGTLKYWQSVNDLLGENKVEKFARFYLFPGMGHCGSGAGQNGAGLNSFDLLTPLMKWVETGKAPNELVATGLTGADAVGGAGQTVTLPIYPYPVVPKYSGSGSVLSASSYYAHIPEDEPGPSTKNAGDYLYTTSFPQIDCGVKGDLIACKGF